MALKQQIGSLGRRQALRPNGRRAARDFDLFDDRMPVRRYKLLLKTFLQRRKSGINQAIADAIGTKRSFVTQMTSPAYDVPLPAQHVRAIVEVAAFTPAERRTFLDAYVEAHPERAAEIQAQPQATQGGRAFTVTLPVLRNAHAQRRLEALLHQTVKDIVATVLLIEEGLGDEEPTP
jgi:hypothetical protein